MKRTISSLIIATLLLTGCKLTEIEYNDQIAASINESSGLIETTILKYDDSIPDTVTEISEIETLEMEMSLSAAKDTMPSINSLMLLQSTSTEQQEAVQTELENYISLAEAYLAKYEETLNYYKNGTYIEDLTMVSVYDKEVYEMCNAFIESNNSLVEILESYT